MIYYLSNNKVFMLREVVHCLYTYSDYLPWIGIGEMLAARRLNTWLEGTPPTPLPEKETPISNELPKNPCLICREELYDKTTNHNITTCDNPTMGHIFHKKCLTDLYISSVNADPACPICRTSLKPHYYDLLQQHKMSPSQIGGRIAKKAIAIFVKYPFSFWFATRHFTDYPIEHALDYFRVQDLFARAMLWVFAVDLIGALIGLDLWPIIFLAEVVGISAGLCYGIICEAPEMTKMIYALAKYEISRVAESFQAVPAPAHNTAVPVPV